MSWNFLYKAFLCCVLGQNKLGHTREWLREWVKDKQFHRGASKNCSRAALSWGRSRGYFGETDLNMMQPGEKHSNYILYAKIDAYFVFIWLKKTKKQLNWLNRRQIVEKHNDDIEQETSPNSIFICFER